MVSKSSRSKVTITDIARASDVSPATVSLVLRDKPGIGDETRQRVLDVAQALGYTYNKPSVQAAQYEAKNIGLIVKTRPDESSPQANYFYAPVIAGIELVCRQQQMNLLYATLPVDEINNPIGMPRLLKEEKSDGILLVGMLVNDQLAAALGKRNAPVVLVDGYAPNHEYDAVVSDNFTGAYEATQYLIDHGHQRIGLVGSDKQSYPSIAERRRGYQQAMVDAGLSPYFVDSGLNTEEASAAVTKLFKHGTNLTAFLGANDEVAIATMRAAQAAGRVVPRDISIIGFDNISLAEHISPALTTMRIDKTGMGRLAMQLLLNRMDFGEASTVRTVIRPNLIERESVARLK